MRPLRATWVRFRNLFRKDCLDREFEAELASHLDLHISDNIRSGMSPAEARRQALLKLGGLQQTKENHRQARGFPFLQSILQDLRFAVRTLRKSPGFTTVAVLTLALGIGASTTVFSVFYNLLFNAFAAKDSSQLVVPVICNEDSPGDLAPAWFRLADFNSIRQNNHSFSDVAGSATGIAQLRNGDQTFQLRIAFVTSNAFRFYGVTPLLGGSIDTDDVGSGPDSTFAISYKTWKSVFNSDRTIIGRTFLVDGEPRTLFGVMPPRFHAYGQSPDIWIPILSAKQNWEQEGRISVLARLKPDVNTRTASADLTVLTKRFSLLHPDDYPKHFSAQVLSANDYLMGPSGPAGVFNSRIQLKSILYALLAAVLVLLLLACSNVASLLTARATIRERELAVRSALGASRGRVTRQLLLETVVLSLAGGAAGSGFAWLGTSVVEDLLHQKSWDRVGAETIIGLNPPVLFFAFAIALCTAFACGLFPALRSSRVDLRPRMASGGSGASSAFSHRRIRGALVIGQITLSIILLVGSGLLTRSLFLLTHIDLGFNPQNILVVAFAPALGRTSRPDRTKVASPKGQMVFQNAIERLQALPGVVSVAVNNTIPGYGPSQGPQVSVPGGAQVEGAGLDECDENCPATLDFRMVRGSWFSRQEAQSGQYVAVINQRLAHDLFGEKDPVGRQLRVIGFRQWKDHLQKAFAMNPPPSPSEADFRIVGVVSDVKNFGPQQPAVPMAFIPPLITGALILQIKTTVSPASLRHAVQEEVWAVDRDQFFWILDPLHDFLQEHTYAVPEFGVMLSAPLAGISLLLATSGIFSVLAYAVSLQTQEFGIRMALGARRTDILRSVLGRGAKLIGSGILLGLIASLALTHFLASQIWGISTTDPWTLGGAVSLLALTGLAASYIPARRATRVDPMASLRYE